MKQNFLTNKHIPVCLFACVAAVILLILFLHPFERRVEQLCEYDIEVFDVLLGGAAGDNPEAQDALRICPSIITTLRYGTESDWTEELYIPIDQLMDKFYEFGYLPRPPHGNLENYVTAMDAPLLAVAAELAYERSGDPRFQKYMEDLIPYIVSDTSENGFILKYSDTEWWPLEYAWTTVSDEDAWFVLNGSLYGMVGVEMLKNLTGDARLQELSEKALNAYQSKIEKFYYPDESWCYYSLNSENGDKTINSIEKLLIETRALQALYCLTDEPFYLDTLNRHRSLLTKILPVYILEDGNTHTAMLLRSCAPHPYQVDIYPSTLELLDGTGKVVTTVQAESDAVKSRTVEYYSIVSEVPDGVTSYRLYGQLNPIEKTLLAEGNVFHIQKSQLSIAPISGTWSVDRDAVSMKDGMLSINTKATEYQQAYVYYTLDEPVAYTPQTYYVVELENPTQETFPMMGYLYDQNGVSMTRTLLPCKPGKSLQILSPLGFKEHEWPLDSAYMLRFAFITNQMQTPQAEIHLGNVFVFHSTAEVLAYLSQYSFSDYWNVSE